MSRYHIGLLIVSLVVGSMAVTGIWGYSGYPAPSLPEGKPEILSGDEIALGTTFNLVDNQGLFILQEPEFEITCDGEFGFTVSKGSQVTMSVSSGNTVTVTTPEEYPGKVEVDCGSNHWTDPTVKVWIVSEHKMARP